MRTHAEICEATARLRQAARKTDDENLKCKLYASAGILSWVLGAKGTTFETTVLAEYAPPVEPEMAQRVM